MTLSIRLRAGGRGRRKATADAGGEGRRAARKTGRWRKGGCRHKGDQGGGQAEGWAGGVLRHHGWDGL
jgi:hypothetical protein